MPEFDSLPRVFVHGAARLADPDPNLSPDEVRLSYAPHYPDLHTATVKGPSYEGGERVFTFARGIGVKG